MSQADTQLQALWSFNICIRGAVLSYFIISPLGPAQHVTGRYKLSLSLCRPTSKPHCCEDYCGFNFPQMVAGSGAESGTSLAGIWPRCGASLVRPWRGSGPVLQWVWRIGVRPESDPSQSYVPSGRFFAPNCSIVILITLAVLHVTVTHFWKAVLDSLGPAQGILIKGSLLK